MNDLFNHNFKEQLKNVQNIVVVSHIRPDGDAIGSILGLGLALQAVGKNVQMILSDGLPSDFHFLPGARHITQRIKHDFDYAIVLDCSDLDRIGGILNDYTPDVCIDHHVTNLNFAKLNLVDPLSASTTSILAEYIPEWELPITKHVAEALLTGILTDTIGFRTSNVTQKTLQLATKMMDYGANLSELYHQALAKRSFESAQYWAKGLEQLQRKNGLVWTTLTLQNRQDVSYGGNDDADLVNMLSTIDHADIALIFIEQKDLTVKISWRAQNGWDVSQLALRYGGGGHPAAAGATISGSLEEVQSQIVQATLNLLEDPNNNRKEKHPNNL